jgi:ABC-type branched-subunit amino acid transport system substrate-binding protein
MLAPDDSVEGEFIGRFAARLGARSITLFYVLDEYGAGLRDGIMAELAHQGIGVLDAVPVNGGGWCPPERPHNDHASVVDAALQRGRPDAIILATRQTEGGCIIGRISRALPAMRFIAGDGITINQQFLARAGAGADSVYLAAFWHPDKPDSMSLAFTRRFRAETGREPTSGDAMIYDAMQVLIAAIEDSPSRAGVHRFLGRLGRERPALPGVTGPIAFPGMASKLVMTRLTAGRPVLVSR